jgi:hypothetical protein
MWYKVVENFEQTVFEILKTREMQFLYQSILNKKKELLK